MLQIKKILLPTDFSDHSLAAIRYAKSLAEQYGAKVYVMNVLDDVTPI